MNNYINSEDVKETFTAKKVVYYVLGFLEVLLLIRLIFKLFGANPNSGFVSIIYTISQILLAPFIAIFRTATSEGIETRSVLEPSTIIAMAIYALLAWGIVKLIVIIREHNDNVSQKIIFAKTRRSKHPFMK